MLFWLLSACHRNSVQVPEASPALAPVASAKAPVLPDLPFQLGINEAVAVPRQLVERGVALEAPLKEDAALVVGLGAKMVRGHTGNFPYVSWSSLEKDPALLAQADLWVGTLQAAGLEPVFMLSPWPGNQTGNFTDRYVPADMDSYKAYVRRMVERYDGDGLDDMPNLLRPVVYWEVDNEPDLKNTNLPRDAVRKYDPSTFCLPEEYATVLMATSAAAREAFAGVRILGGGFYRPAAEGTWAYVDRLLAIPGLSDAFDILSLHTYTDTPQRITTGIQAMRQRFPQKPVWVTEISVPSQGKEPFLSERYQAEMVVAFSATAAAAGASAFFWHGLSDPPGDRRLKSYALLSTDSLGQHPSKPSGQVYQQLAKVLASHDLNGAQEVAEGQLRLVDGSVLLYSGSMTVSTSGVSLWDGSALAAGAMAQAPAWLAL